MRRKGLTALAAMMVLLAAPQARADEGLAPYWDGAMTKLGRGIANIFTSPAELLRTPSLHMQREGTLAGSTVGVIHGVWRMLLRGVTGVFEVVTFCAEIPKDFAPLMHPEYVWAHGNWVP